ncbi:hypothetical protein C2845_PM04G20360 [Panicum miliaceum]|uniref:Uncharacterized protein n=1 Tax=Panicum miliaceum TaxID=4540 RepID=A0A3L6QLT8_PANMI|nr:hypothetical protein C2845_PM04G20360 [Panicum miliaceum]
MTCRWGPYVIISGSLGKKNCAAAIRSSSTTTRRWGRLVPHLLSQPRRIPRLLPCPDHGSALQANHFPSAPPRAAFPWAPPLLALQKRLAEEGKRKDRRNSCGLLREIHALEKCVQRLAEAIDAAPAPHRRAGGCSRAAAVGCRAFTDEAHSSRPPDMGDEATTPKRRSPVEENEDVGPDVISRLPDDVLGDVVTLLPTADSART